MAVMILAILHRTAQTRFLHQDHHTIKTDLMQGIDTPTTKVTHHTPIMVSDIGESSAGHSLTVIPTMTEAAVLEDTCLARLLVTTVACATLQPIDALITPHTVISTGIVAPHLALTTSPTGITHTTPWTGASLTP